MKKHEIYTSVGLRNMAGRVGRLSSPELKESSLESVSMLTKRLNQMGGRTQQERMIRDKRRSLDKALLYSYQGAFVKKIQDLNNIPFPEGEEENQPPVRALINPDKVKQDYDDKIISIGYEHDYKAGDVFEWVNTNSHWLIYLQDKTELAYFRGEIRRCRYTINYQDEDGIVHTTYAAIRGPVETKINFIQKSGISVDRPNFSLHILLPGNQSNIDYFNRYNKFYLMEDNKKICWRVEAVDWISTPGILEIEAVEYYVNEFEDNVEDGVVGGLAVKEENPNTSRIENLIEGETFIKPKGVYEYKYTGLTLSTWEIDKSKYPLEYKIIDDRTIKVRWTAGYSGQFEIQYGDLTKTIVVESLF